MNDLQVSKNNVKLGESVFLSVTFDWFLNRTNSALKSGDLGIAQGALRAVYNCLGELIYDSKYLSDTRKELLKRFNNNISGIRDDILSGVEEEHRDLAEVVGSYNVYGRIESAKAALKRYIDYWYHS